MIHQMKKKSESKEIFQKRSFNAGSHPHEEQTNSKIIKEVNAKKAADSEHETSCETIVKRADNATSKTRDISQTCTLCIITK